MRGSFGDRDILFGPPGAFGDEILEGNNDGLIYITNEEELPSFEEFSVLVDNNTGTTEKAFNNVNGYTHLEEISIFNSGNKHAASIKEIKDVNEKSGCFIGVEEERNTLIIQQGVSAENQKTVAAKGFASSISDNWTGNSVVSMHRAGLCVEDMKETNESCENYLPSFEKNGLLVADQGLCVIPPDTTTDVVPRESLSTTCFDCGGRGIHSSADNRKENTETYERSVWSVKMNDYLDLEDKQLLKGAKIIDEEKHHRIPSLSSSLKSTDVYETSAAAGALKVEDSIALSCNEKGCKRGGIPPLGYPGLTIDCSSISVDGLMPHQVEPCITFSDNLDATCVGSFVVGKVEDTLFLDADRLECSLPKDKLPVLDCGNGEKHEPFDSLDDQGLCSSSLRELRQDAFCVEGKFVSPQQTVDGAVYLVSNIARGLSEGSLEEVASCFSGAGSSLQQSFTACTAALGHSFDPSPGTNYDRTATGNFNMPSTSCSNVKESCGKVSERGMVDSKLDPTIVFRRTNPKRAVSLRNKQMDSKPNHLTRKRNKARKCKTVADASSSFSIQIKPTRKRSCFNRMARRSLWGESSNLMTSFTVNDGSGTSTFVLDQIQNKPFKRTQYRRAKGEIQTGSRGNIVKSLQTQLSFSTDSAHLKDENNWQLNVLNVADSHCSLEGRDIALPNSSSTAEVGIPNIHGEAGVLAHVVSFVQQDGQQADKDIESTLTQDVSVDDMLGECPGISSEMGLEALVHTVVEKQLLDQESSPDSDIYNPIASAIPTDTDILRLQDVGEDHESVLPLDMQHQTGNKKVLVEKVEKTMQKAYDLYEDTLINDKFQNLKTENIAAEPLKYVRKKRNGYRGKNLVSLESKNEANMKASIRSFLGESSIHGKAELDHNEEPLQELECKTWTLPDNSIRNIQPEGELLMSDKIKGKKVTKSGRMSLVKGKATKTDSSRPHRLKSFDKKKHDVVKLEKTRNKKKNQILDAGQEVCRSTSGSPTLTCNESELKNSSTGLDSQSLRKRQAWVLCDDCQKWRCIPTALADTIEQTNCNWTCKDNTDKAFADCSIPQEKTNSEINAELEITDASCDEDAPKKNFVLPVKSKLANQPAPWVHVKSNVYLHRSRKSQTIDESEFCFHQENLLCISSFCNYRELSLWNNRCTAVVNVGKDLELIEKISLPLLFILHCVGAIPPCIFPRIDVIAVVMIMVCHCKPPSDGSLGCRDQCLNRMLNIECVKGTCPCGELCSNQQFQKRKYSRLKSIPCGKKGFGLQSLHNVSRGQFLIEYVGEVLDFATYEARQRDYGSRGQRHFYFMTLNGGEVIDACAKGNLGRFINHSCEPNCRTEKGEELTFDYNYVRIFGAAAKKCVCGSSVCRGYIGADPLSTEVIVQDDTDDEYPEPIMVHKASAKASYIDMSNSDAHDFLVKDTYVSIEKKKLLDECSPVSVTDNCQQLKDTLCASSHNDTVFTGLGNLKVRNSVSRRMNEVKLPEDRSNTLDNQKEEILCSPLIDVQQINSPSKASPLIADVITDSVNIASTSDTSNEQLNMVKTNIPKSSQSSQMVKKIKPCVKAVVPPKSKRSSVQSSNAGFERVEKELNELLDANGGISKRKDATRGYLKLLVLTAAAGDNVGGASQSIRDLSLILDALLKTKSRTVLMDITNKNGLQMLHNIMKQNRSIFSRIPIIRKLLKVLEFLALKEILTPEHINKGPPCSGMERTWILVGFRMTDGINDISLYSFKESMLSLTRHNDNQVQQIARNFRDKWIPRTIKRIEPSDRDVVPDSQRSYSARSHLPLFQCHLDLGSRDSDAIVCVSEPMEQPIIPTLLDQHGETFANLTDNNSNSGTRTRKRKSRWDQPSDDKVSIQQNIWSREEQTTEPCLKLKKTAFSNVEFSSTAEVLRHSYESQTKEDCGASSGKTLVRRSTDEVPPGFGSALKNHVSHELINPRGEVVVGHRQDRYLSHMTVSYGIPVTLVQKLGTPGCEVDSEDHNPWKIAPSIPFHPFPPLPSYPRGQPNHQNLGTGSLCISSVHASSATHLCKPGVQDYHSADAPVQSVSAGMAADKSKAWPRNPQIRERMNWTNNGRGRRFFQPERRNNQKFRRCAPWSQEGNASGLASNSRCRDSGKTFRDERKYWPPFPQEDCVNSKAQKGR
ncbi:hypothetical protein ZIOFF_058878 [Zingiber officinale]|uniref:Histone-lysine N-methyltransferase ASHH2 n=1 Tax=Zingiber officinale TaxID=94328 RepID=A0A8J5F487_ZINOF|nr:hypothetical protein ZIOFF_058878 [Zingiber officinale]